MLRRFALALSLGLLATSWGQMPDIRRDFILLDKDAVGMLSPRVVCAAYTGSLSWSTDGSMLLAYRIDSADVESQAIEALGGQAAAPSAPKAEILFYSFKGNRVKSAIPLVDQGVRIQKLEWLPNSSQAALVYTRLHEGADGGPPVLQTVAAILSSDGRVRSLGMSGDNESLEVEVSRKSPEAVVVRRTFIPPPPGSGRTLEIRGTITFVPATGSPGAAIPLPPNYTRFAWGTDGQPYISSRIILPDRKGFRMQWQRVERSTGRLGQPASTFKEAEDGVPTSTVRGLAAGQMDFKPVAPKSLEGKMPNLRGVILATDIKSDQSFTFVSSDASEGLLSPSGDAVAYIHHGVALVRPLVHIPKDAYLAAMAAAKRQELIQNAKQVALSFIMFASDNDDQLPGAGANWQDTLNPYARNSSIFDGFVFTLAGKNLSKIDSPASTELGYINGPGGRAVAYADGHVKWIPGT